MGRAGGRRADQPLTHRSPATPSGWRGSSVFSRARAGARSRPAWPCRPPAWSRKRRRTSGPTRCPSKCQELPWSRSRGNPRSRPPTSLSTGIGSEPRSTRADPGSSPWSPDPPPDQLDRAKPEPPGDSVTRREDRGHVPTEPEGPARLDLPHRHARTLSQPSPGVSTFACCGRDGAPWGRRDLLSVRMTRNHGLPFRSLRGRPCA